MASRKESMCPLLPILRGITLHGAISVDATCELRELAWAMLADDSDLEALDALTTTIGPDDTLRLPMPPLKDVQAATTVVQISWAGGGSAQ